MTVKKRLTLLLCAGLLFGCGQDDPQPPVNEPPPDKLEGLTRHPDTTDINVEPDLSNPELFIQDISEREYGKVNAIAIMFSNPLAPDQTFHNYLNITPPLADPVLSRDGRKLYFPDLQPETEYFIEVDAGIKAVNGKKLGRAINKTVKTLAMTPGVAFESEGMVMVPDYTEALPVIAVNVPEADLNIYRVKDGNAAQFFEYYQYNATHSMGDFLRHTYTARIKTGEMKNARNRVLVPLSHLGQKQEPGVYFATLGKPGAFNPAKTWFTVSSIGLQLRTFQDHTRLIAQDITSGSLLPDIHISILNYASKILDQGKTDHEGSYVFSRPEPYTSQNQPALILATKNNETTVLPYRTPSFDLSGFAVSGRPTRQEVLYTYSPRDIYRPGETAIISVLKRNDDGQPISGPVNMEIHKPDGSPFNHWLVDSPAAGYHELSFMIPAGAPTGNWQARVYSPGNESADVIFPFKVEEFLPERLSLTFNPGQQGLTSFTPQDALKVNVLGEYLYGAPANANKLDTRVRLTAWGSPFERLKDYIFGNPGQPDGYREELPSVQLDKGGTTLTELPDNISLSEWQIPTRVNLQYSLYETGGRAINRQYNVLYWPKETFIGIKPLFNNQHSDSDSSARFTLLKTNRYGELQTSGEAKAELYREEKKYFWTYTQNRGWHYQVIENEYLAATRDVRFISTQPVALDLPVEWGRYRLEVTDLQSQGKTTYFFDAGEDWYANWRSASDVIRPDRVSLALNRKSYKAGETALIRIGAPTDGKALVMLEADKVLHIVEVQLKDKQAEVEVPIPSDIARHDLYVSAFVIAPTESTEKIAKRSFGIIPLPLDREDRLLNVSIDVPESWRPEQQVHTSLRVHDQNGQIVDDDVYLTLSAADSGILSVTGYQTENPYHYFYSQRQYSGRITDMFDQVLEYSLADTARLRWGGDEDLTRGGEKAKTDVQMVSLFSGLVQVSGGQAQIPLDLPQFEGELTLTAISFSGDRFGKDKTTVKVASPIVTQLSAPRFLAPGDQTTLAFDVVNMSGADQTVKLMIKTEAPLSSDATEQVLQLKDSQKEVVSVPIRAGRLAGQGQIRANIRFANETLTRHWSLGVRDAYPAGYDIISSVLTPGKVLGLQPDQLAGLIPETVRGQLRIGQMPDLQAEENWDYLSQYLYACLEQTASKAASVAALSLSGLDPQIYNKNNTTMSDNDLDPVVQSALTRYAELQLASGGFALWSRGADEDRWLTVYTTETMSDLKKAGYSVPDSLLKPALKRLKQYVTFGSPQSINRWSRSPSYTRLAYKAYAAYVLAREGMISLGPLRDIAERELPDTLSPLPGIHLGLAMIATGSPAEGEKLITKALGVQRKEDWYLGDYGSVIRDQSMVINSLLKAGVMKDEALSLLLTLHNNLLKTKYLSTQERSVLFSLAMTLEPTTDSIPWRGELVTGEQTEILEKTGDFIKSFDHSDLLFPVSFTNTTDDNDLQTNNLFVSFAWSGIPAEQPEKVENGIRVRVSHYRVTGGTAEIIEDTEDIHVGDIILSRLSVLADRPVPDALLVSLMPAGLELENQNLDNALKLGDITIDEQVLSQKATFEYQEFRDDRYVAALELPENDEQILFFISRAVTPGKYQSPPALVESMYTPKIRGVSNRPEPLKVVK